MSIKHTPEPWRIEKLHTRRVIRGANSSLVGVIESGMSDEDAARLEQRLSTTAPADPAKGLELARDALGLSIEAMEHSVPDDCWSTGPYTGDPIEDLVICPYCRAIAKCRSALAALTPTKEVGR